MGRGALDSITKQKSSELPNVKKLKMVQMLMRPAWDGQQIQPSGELGDYHRCVMH